MHADGGRAPPSVDRGYGAGAFAGLNWNASGAGEMKQHFMMFAAYNQWANGRIYDAAADLNDAEFERDVGAFFGSMMGTLNHLLVADRVWMKRFSGEGDAPAPWDRSRRLGRGRPATRTCAAWRIWRAKPPSSGSHTT